MFINIGLKMEKNGKGKEVQKAKKCKQEKNGKGKEVEMRKKLKN